MIRTFQAKIPASSWVLIAVITWMAGYAAWYRHALLLLIALVLLIVVIERVLHTEYIVSSDTLIVRNGRFTRIIEIKLADIESVEEISRMNIGGKPLVKYLIINHQNKITVVNPRDKEAFLKSLSR